MSVSETCGGSGIVDCDVVGREKGSRVCDKRGGGGADVARGGEEIDIRGGEDIVVSIVSDRGRNEPKVLVSAVSNSCAEVGE